MISGWLPLFSRIFSSAFSISNSEISVSVIIFISILISLISIYSLLSNKSILWKLQNHQLFGNFRKKPATIPLHKHRILNSDATEAGDIDARFDGENHSFLDNAIAPIGNDRLFVNFQADPVTQAVAEVAAEPFTFDITPGYTVQLLDGYARFNRSYSHVMGRLHNSVDLFLPGVW